MLRVLPGLVILQSLNSEPRAWHDTLIRKFSLSEKSRIFIGFLNISAQNFLSFITMIPSGIFRSIFWNALSITVNYLQNKWILENLECFIFQFPDELF